MKAVSTNSVQCSGVVVYLLWSCALISKQINLITIKVAMKIAGPKAPCWRRLFCGVILRVFSQLLAFLWAKKRVKSWLILFVFFLSLLIIYGTVFLKRLDAKKYVVMIYPLAFRKRDVTLQVLACDLDSVLGLNNSVLMSDLM